MRGDFDLIIIKQQYIYNFYFVIIEVDVQALAERQQFTNIRDILQQSPQNKISYADFIEVSFFFC